MLLALLIMTTIMVASTGLAVIVISEIRQARSIDNSILAYYGAESGVEESLYKIRQQEAALADLVKAEDLTNGVGWFLKSEDVSDMMDKVEINELKSGQFVELDIYNPEGLPTDTRYLEIILKEQPLDKIGFEVSWFGWEQGELSKYASQTVDFSSFTYDEGSGYYRLDPPIDLADDLAEKFAYRVKIKALYNTVNFMEIRAYNEASEARQIPARIAAAVRGEYRGSRQTINFEMPRQSPLGGLFDFVLFSEESILKGVSE